MSTDTPDVSMRDAGSIKEAIYDAIEAHADDRGHAPLGDVVDAARREVPQTADAIHNQLEQMQKRGDIYPVDGKVAITEDRR